MGFSKEDISETTWRWRCKIKQSISGGGDRTLADFSSADSSSVDDLKPGPPTTVAATTELGVSAPVPSARDPGLGANPSVKTLYEGTNSDESYVDWVDYPPRQLSKSAVRAHDRVAIKLYKVKDKDKPVVSGRFALRYHRIDVQNPLLVAFLEPLLKREEEHLDLNAVATFKEPFRALYFCYDAIAARQRALDRDDPVRPFALLLVRVLDDVFADLRVSTRALREGGLVSFHTAWTYFARGSVVVSWGHNCELLCKVVDATVKRGSNGAPTHLAVQCRVLRFGGEAFVWEDEELAIPFFEGNKLVRDLPHYPLEFHEDPEGVKARMVERGRRLLDLQGLTYCCYSGLAILLEPAKKKIEKHNVEGRILIDVLGYKKHHLATGSREEQDPQSKKNVVPGTGRPPKWTAPSPSAAPPALPIAYFDSCGVTYHDPGQVAVDARLAAAREADRNDPAALPRLTLEEQQRNKEVMLRDESSLMFVYPLLEGYALKNKLWLNFYIEDIKPMVWNDQAFDHLVYDEQQKDLVLSFVENHGPSTTPDMADVIIGKGQGMIILLSGPPGTGKTLMAEAVADKTKRPLFYLQAEDLGINAATLGANIKAVFQMATEWNAVILLDEADVFMAQRHPQDIARNELVSIFLRELEYFRGIIFLTTNLYDTIDSAFRSRVSLHLLFKPLTVDARLLVWRKFLDRLTLTSRRRVVAGPKPTTGGDAQEEARVDDEEEELIPEEDLHELALWNLNGREIKNAVRMVRSWCDHKGYVLSLERIENGIRVTAPHAAKQSARHDTSLYDS